MNPRLPPYDRIGSKRVDVVLHEFAAERRGEELVACGDVGTAHVGVRDPTEFGAAVTVEHDEARAVGRADDDPVADGIDRHPPVAVDGDRWLMALAVAHAERPQRRPARTVGKHQHALGPAGIEQSSTSGTRSRTSP